MTQLLRATLGLIQDITGNVTIVHIKTECDGYLRDEIGLPVEERRWWDTYKGNQRHLEVPKKWVKNKEK